MRYYFAFKPNGSLEYKYIKYVSNVNKRDSSINCFIMYKYVVTVIGGMNLQNEKRKVNEIVICNE